MVLFQELDDEGQAAARPILSDVICKVASVKRGDDDNPFYQQAMSGAERQFWREACEEEVANLERNEVFQPIPEDSLPTWDARKGRAADGPWWSRT